METEKRIIARAIQENKEMKIDEVSSHLDTIREGVIKVEQLQAKTLEIEGKLPTSI